MRRTFFETRGVWILCMRRLGFMRWVGAAYTVTGPAEVLKAAAPGQFLDVLNELRDLTSEADFYRSHPGQRYHHHTEARS